MLTPLLEMGFERKSAAAALQHTGDCETALQLLLAPSDSSPPDSPPPDSLPPDSLPPIARSPNAPPPTGPPVAPPPAVPLLPPASKEEVHSAVRALAALQARKQQLRGVVDGFMMEASLGTVGTDADPARYKVCLR